MNQILYCGFQKGRRWRESEGWKSRTQRLRMLVQDLWCVSFFLEWSSSPNMHMHMLKPARGGRHAIAACHCFCFHPENPPSAFLHLANGAQFFNERSGGNVENVGVPVWMSERASECVRVSLWFMNIGLASDRFCHFQLPLFVVASALLGGQRERKLFLMVTAMKCPSPAPATHTHGYWYVSPSSAAHLNCIYAHASINQAIYQNMSFDRGRLGTSSAAEQPKQEGIDLWAQIVQIARANVWRHLVGPVNQDGDNNDRLCPHFRRPIIWRRVKTNNQALGKKGNGFEFK